MGVSSHTTLLVFSSRQQHCHHTSEMFTVYEFLKWLILISYIYNININLFNIHIYICVFNRPPLTNIWIETSVELLEPLTHNNTIVCLWQCHHYSSHSCSLRSSFWTLRHIPLNYYWCFIVGSHNETQGPHWTHERRIGTPSGPCYQVRGTTLCSSHLRAVLTL